MNPREIEYSKLCNEGIRAYYIYTKQCMRNTVTYTRKEFINWWLQHINKKDWVCASCGRIDHSKGYSFDNIEMQELSDNVKERNARLGNPGKSHRKVKAICTKTGVVLKLFNSKRDAAKFYIVSEKTIYNHANARTKQFFKFGMNVKGRDLSVRFEYD